MVQVTKEQLESLFEYKDGLIIGKESTLRRKESNTRVAGKPLGCNNTSGHLVMSFTIDGVKYKKLVHHVVWFMHYGVWPEMLDHIDRNPQNNRVENLREADKRINSINRVAPANSTSGVRGVSKNKRTGRWEVYIGNNGKRTNLGHFDCIGQAIKARKAAEQELWADAFV